MVLSIYPASVVTAETSKRYVVYGLRCVTTKLTGSFHTELILLRANVLDGYVVRRGGVTLPRVGDGLVVLHRKDSLFS